MCVCVSCSAVTPEHHRGAPKEEFFITDIAYCEQAVIFLKQAKLPQNNSQRRKEDGTLPVSIQTLSYLSYCRPRCLQENSGIKFENVISHGELCKCRGGVVKWEDNLQTGHKGEILTYVSLISFSGCESTSEMY